MTIDVTYNGNTTPFRILGISAKYDLKQPTDVHAFFYFLWSHLRNGNGDEVFDMVGALIPYGEGIRLVHSRFMDVADKYVSNNLSAEFEKPDKFITDYLFFLTELVPYAKGSYEEDTYFQQEFIGYCILLLNLCQDTKYITNDLLVDLVMSEGGLARVVNMFRFLSNGSEETNRPQVNKALLLFLQTLNANFATHKYTPSSIDTFLDCFKNIPAGKIFEESKMDTTNLIWEYIKLLNFIWEGATPKAKEVVSPNFFQQVYVVVNKMFSDFNKIPTKFSLSMDYDEENRITIKVRDKVKKQQVSITFPNEGFFVSRAIKPKFIERILDAAHEKLSAPPVSAATQSKPA